MKFNLLSFFSHIFSFFLFSILILTLSQEAQPAVASTLNHLTPCKDSTTFTKRLTSSVKKLENRLKISKRDSKEAKTLLNEIDTIQNRLDRYTHSGLLCGKEGLPRIIVNEFFIPGILFLYITGWIGWSGRKYLRYARTTENPFENEIILYVPVALSMMNSGFWWPIEFWNEFISGDLLEAEEDVTISPR